MSSLEVPLNSIRGALQGAVPAALATCGADGTPNVTHMSIVQYVDEDRVALPRQFLRKTEDNLAENPVAQVLVVCPQTLDQYVLDLAYLHTERDGPVFDSIAANLEAMAAQAGVSAPSNLYGVDTHRVLTCAGLRDDQPPGPPPEPVPDVLGQLDEFLRRIEEADDRTTATKVALEGLEELYGITYSILFAGDGTRLRPLANNGYGATGSPELGRIPELLRIATEQGQVVAVPNLPRGLVMAAATADDPERCPAAVADGTKAINLSGPESVLSVAAVPLIHRGTPLGVLYLEDEAAGRFGPNDERLLRILGRQIALTLSSLEPAETGRHEPIGVTYYQADDSVFFGDDYVIKGVPGRILWKLLREHVQHGRVHFTNRELRLDESLELPPGNDNLDSRLISLRRRLARGAWGIALERVGRGRLRLRVEGGVSMTEVPTLGPMRRDPTWPVPAGAHPDFA